MHLSLKEIIMDRVNEIRTKLVSKGFHEVSNSVSKFTSWIKEYDESELNVGLSGTITVEVTPEEGYIELSNSEALVPVYEDVDFPFFEEILSLI